MHDNRVRHPILYCPWLDRAAECASRETLHENNPTCSLIHLILARLQDLSLLATLFSWVHRTVPSGGIRPACQMNQMGVFWCNTNSKQNEFYWMRGFERDVSLHQALGDFISDISSHTPQTLKQLKQGPQCSSSWGNGSQCTNILAAQNFLKLFSLAYV